MSAALALLPPTVTSTPAATPAWRAYLSIAFVAMCRLNSAVKTAEFRHLRGDVYSCKESFADLAERAGCLAGAELEPGGLTRLVFNVDGRRFEFHSRRGKPRTIGDALVDDTPGPRGTRRRYTRAQRRARVESWLRDVKYVLAAEQAAEKGLPEPPAPSSCAWIAPPSPEDIAAAEERQAREKAERQRARLLRPGARAVLHRLAPGEEPGPCVACGAAVPVLTDYRGRARVLEYRRCYLCLRCVVERDPEAPGRLAPTLTLRRPYTHRNYTLRPRWEETPTA